jgi:polysaccharide export outer membrane protein
MYNYLTGKRNYQFAAIALMLLAIIATSCATKKQMGYSIAGLSDSLKAQLPDIKVPASVIQPDDILEIKFSAANAATATEFNTKGNSYSAGGSTSGTGSSNYLVDAEGNVEIYLAGKVKVTGYTKEQARTVLLSAVDKWLKEANVTVRFANFRFTLLGEVKAAGSFSIPNEKISILEAVAMGGDLTSNAKRDIVRVIRDSSGIREMGTVNFNQKTLFTSPYYYLHRNDIIIVERDNKAPPTQLLNTVSSIVGITSSIITLFFIITK